MQIPCGKASPFLCKTFRLRALPIITAMLLSGAILVSPTLSHADEEMLSYEEQQLLEALRSKAPEEGNEKKRKRRYEWPPKIIVRDETSVSKIQLTSLERAVERLNTSDQTLFEKAVFEFEQLGERAVPTLVSIMRRKDYDDQIYLNAIYATGRIGRKAEAAVPTIMSFLQHANPDFRAVSALALGKMGPDANKTVIYLREMLDDNNPWVRRSAELALTNIGTPHAKRSLREYKLKLLRERRAN